LAGLIPAYPVNWQKTEAPPMSTITFDTHEFIKELRNAGFSEEQAEIITKLQKAAVSSTFEQTRHE